jgi:hypothetical protein
MVMVKYEAQGFGIAKLSHYNHGYTSPHFQVGDSISRSYLGLIYS